MKQSRLASFLEQCANTASGFLISLVAQWWFLPQIGVAISLEQNFIFACFMTVVSVARGYAWRRLMEALHIRAKLSPAMLAIIAERRRQIEVEGWTPEHDDKYPPGELARAGACYALYAAARQLGGAAGVTLRTQALSLWPWRREWHKSTVLRRDLVKAGALILADIERHDRQRKPRAIKTETTETLDDLGAVPGRAGHGAAS